MTRPRDRFNILRMHARLEGLHGLRFPFFPRKS